MCEATGVKNRVKQVQGKPALEGKKWEGGCPFRQSKKCLEQVAMRRRSEKETVNISCIILKKDRFVTRRQTLSLYVVEIFPGLHCKRVMEGRGKPVFVVSELGEDDCFSALLLPCFL